MNPDKRNMLKIIAVAALGAVLVGCVVYQVVGKGASAAPPAPAPQKEVATTTQQQSPATGVTADAEAEVKTEAKAQAAVSEAKTVRVAMALPANRRDPFAPCMTPQEFQPQSAAMPRIHGNRRLPSLGTGSLPPLVPPGANTLSISPIGTAVASVDATPKFVLTGVINGNTRVAIIRAGDSERHIVREGQLINGKYFVRSVGRDGVLLTHGSQRIYLKLGGAANAS